MQLAHFREKLVKIGVFFSHFGRNCIETINHIRHIAHTVLHILKHALLGIKVRLLREIANADPIPSPCFTGKLSVIARHDLHQCRFTSAVDTDDRDFSARKELQMNVVEDRLWRAGEGLAQALHYI